MKSFRWLFLSIAGTTVIAACIAGGQGSPRNENSGRTVTQAGYAARPSIDWAAVGRALGKPGSIQPGDVFRVGLPRTDLQVTVGGTAIKPALALGSWVAFKESGANEAVAMGDLVLLDTDVAPVTTKLQEGGIEQTAIHNHLLNESPHVTYMHIRGRGDPVKVAAAIHSALVMTRVRSLGEVPAATNVAVALDLDTALIAHTLGRSGKGEWRRLPGERATSRGHHPWGDGNPAGNGSGHRDQLPAGRGTTGRGIR